MNLQTLFPNGSNAFFQANHQIQSTEPQPPASDALDRENEGETKSGKRITLRYRIYRVRCQDNDNAFASTKQITDALVLSGLLCGDDPTKIKTIVEQEKVEHFGAERIELTIKYP